MREKRSWIIDPETGLIEYRVMEEGVCYKQVPSRYLPEEYHDRMVYEGGGKLRRDVDSLGKTDDDVRSLIREMGYQPTSDNVARIGREVRRTQSENDRVDEIGREMVAEKGVPKLTDAKGTDILAKVKEAAMGSASPKGGGDA